MEKKRMENKMQDSWRERLRDLYLVENDNITSPNSIDFNWGSFLFKRKTSKPAHFYLTTQDGLEDFIDSEISKAREEGTREYIELLQGLEHYEGLKMIRGLQGLDNHEKREYYDIKKRFKELSKLTTK